MFFTAKEIIDKMKRQPAKWGEIFENDMTSNGLISKLYKHLIQLHIKQKNRQTTYKKRAEGPCV